jgi:hypothetical protein
MMHGRAFLEFALSLINDESEASKRSQISRAYYAAFLEARQHSHAWGLHVLSRRPQEHGEVAKALGSLNRQLHFDLSTLRSLRNGADYDLHLDEDTITRQTEQAHRLATSIIQRVDELADVAEPNAGESEVE